MTLNLKQGRHQRPLNAIASMASHWLKDFFIQESNGNEQKLSNDDSCPELEVQYDSDALVDDDDKVPYGCCAHSCIYTYGMSNIKAETKSDSNNNDDMP
jgi:hypothetical protein